MKTSLIAITLAGLFAGANACQANTQVHSPPPQLPAPGPDGSYHRELPSPPPREARYIGLDFGPELKPCHIEAPKFFFNEGEQPRPEDVEKVDALAACLNRPEMIKTDVLLVGHADPRGSHSYNQKLSLERARTIKKYLIKFGVAPKRISISGVGDSQAVGDKPMYSYGYDRRVDAIQIGLVMSP